MIQFCRYYCILFTHQLSLDFLYWNGHNMSKQLHDNVIKWNPFPRYGCQPDEPQASLATDNRCNHVYVVLFFILLFMYAVIHCTMLGIKLLLLLLLRSDWPFVSEPVSDGFPSQRPVTRSFDVFLDLRLNKWLSKQPRRRGFETPSRSL